MTATEPRWTATAPRTVAPSPSTRRSGTGVWAVEAFVKAPVVDVADLDNYFDDHDVFGAALALSGDGVRLAVGAPREDSASTGTFAPGDAGYQAALDSDGATNSGAVTVYRRSTLTDTWATEAFVKAPVVDVAVPDNFIDNIFDDDDVFGTALALSGDGATLAVGAPNEDSASTGTFAPGDAGYQAALDDDRVFLISGGLVFGLNAGAVYVYRRSGSAWSLEAFVKAPATGGLDFFGTALALSRDGATLAAVARTEGSASTGIFVPADGAGYRDALDDNAALQSGAAYIYRRSDAGRWAIEAFIKAPRVRAGDQFGAAFALSADGGTLAVGALRGGTSVAAGVFAPGDAGYQAALDVELGIAGTSAAYVYRRSTDGHWALEAFVKAPATTAGFGDALALSADGSVLAVGAPSDHSGATGVFAPGDAGYQAALDSDDFVSSSGAAYVYRRSVAGRWAFEALVKAPVAGGFDYFGTALALSRDGATLAAGAPDEDGGALPQPVGGGSADAENAVENSGAAYLY